MIKRLFDIIVSFLGLVFLSPVFLIIGLMVKLDSEGPVFYRGVRVERFGKQFRIFKFRTMVRDAEELGGPSTAADDPRLTRTGRFLRKYKLDELPQLISILRGEMSFVGPRPEVKMYVDMMSEEEKKIILSVKPGLTDLASLENMSEGERLRGSKDPEKDYLEKIRPTKIRLQKEYVKTRSFILDIKILLYTLWRIFF